MKDFLWSLIEIPLFLLFVFLGMAFMFFAPFTALYLVGSQFGEIGTVIGMFFGTIVGFGWVLAFMEGI